MKHIHCTLFDHRYLSRGLVMIRSLRRVMPEAQVWVLCLDDAAFKILRQIREDGVHPLSLAEFEAGDPELVAAKVDGRSQIEYYFSAKPSLIAHVMRAMPYADYVSYLDADLWFFADPRPTFAEAPHAAALLTPHRFPQTAREHARYGRFNAGWLSFRRSPEGMEALQWWRARCLEWCFDRVDEANDRYADQRYLDQMIADFPGTHAVRHRGANLAPWNVGACRLVIRDGAVTVDGEDPLLFFHVHGIRNIGGGFYITPRDVYRGPTDAVLHDRIYRPYLKTLQSIDCELQPLMPVAAKPLRQLTAKAQTGRIEGVKAYLRIVRAFTRGALLHVPK